MDSRFDLSGQVALVTGASSGLGVQMARALASHGAKLAVLARREQLVEQVARGIEEDFAVDVLALTCDITCTQAVQAAVRSVMDRFGRIDILVNNAGTGAVAPAEAITDEQFSHELEVDLFGTFKMAREVACVAMLPASYGRIVNIASMYGMVGNKIAPSSPYHAAKGGVVNLTRALAAEWATRGITVNAICPGYFYTPLTVDTLDSDFFQSFAQTVIPAERYGREGELDTAVLFLSAPASAYVTGVVLPVDGGYTCV